LDYYYASSLQQQANDRQIILTPSQLVFVLTPYSFVLSGETANARLVVFGMTRPALDFTIYRTQCEYTMTQQRQCQTAIFSNESQDDVLLLDSTCICNICAQIKVVMY